MKILVTTGVVVVGLIALIVPGGSSGSSTSSAASLQTIQADVTDGALLVDVRTPAEFSQEHANNAQNISLQSLQQGNFGAIAHTDKDQKIYVYCRSGNRSAQAVTILQKAGYTNVKDIQSLNAWKAMGGQTES